MDIAFFTGCLGKLSLDKKFRDRNAYNSKAEPFYMLQILSNENPDSTIHVMSDVGRFDKYDEHQMDIDFPNKNVVFAMNELMDLHQFQSKTEENIRDVYKSMDKWTEFNESFIQVLIKYTKLMNITHGYSFNCMNDLVVPGRTRSVTNPEKMVRVLVCNSQEAYTVEWLTRTRLEYISVCVDQRYNINNHRYCDNLPKAVLSVVGEEKEIIVADRFKDDTSVFSLKSENRRAFKVQENDEEKLLLYGMDKSVLDYPFWDKKYGSKFVIFSNQVAGAPFDRFSFLKNDFNLFDEFEIGKDFDFYSNMIGKKFDGKIDKDIQSKMLPTLPQSDLYEALGKGYRYALLPPNSEYTAVTPKLLETILCGTIPFFIQNEKGHYVSDEYRMKLCLPSALGVKDAAHLREKIERLESNEVQRGLLIDHILKEIRSEKLIDGSIFADRLKSLSNEVFSRSF